MPSFECPRPVSQYLGSGSFKNLQVFVLEHESYDTRHEGYIVHE